MAGRKKEAPKYTVTFEYPKTDEENEAFANILCRFVFGMNLEQTVKDIANNPGGKYDALYESGETA